MKTILIFLLAIILISCSDAKMSDAIVVKQINICGDGIHKYEVQLKTDINSNSVFYYTNFRHQVGDTMISYYENFENKNSNNQEKASQIINLKRQLDSIKKELEYSNYYLSLLKGKIVFDTDKK